MKIRLLQPEDFDATYRIINDAAQAYRNVIPPACWHDPYMPREELASEIEHGVVLWGCEESGLLHTYWSIPERQVETSLVPANALRGSLPAGPDSKA